jgi:hypothetical protein
MAPQNNAKDALQITCFTAGIEYTSFSMSSLRSTFGCMPLLLTLLAGCSSAHDSIGYCCRTAAANIIG